MKTAAAARKTKASLPVAVPTERETPKRIEESESQSLLGRDPGPPDWCEETPRPQVWFELTMWSEGMHTQGIDITRWEFVRLKGYLAKLRHLPYNDTDGDRVIDF